MNLPLLRKAPRHAPVPSLSGVAFRSTARSHVGLVRLINEDRAFESSEHSLWAVADGMGGHRGGDLAANEVIEALRNLVDRNAELCADAVAAALQNANRAIVARNRRDGGDAGTTVVAAFADGDGLTIFWAGDSRAYLIRDGALLLQSKDHSLVQQLIDAGLISMDAAATHPQANVVTRALGVADDVAIDCARVSVEPGDRLLLCSDGLSRSIRAGDVSAADGDLDAIADRLLAGALMRDGSDNTTMVLVEAV